MDYLILHINNILVDKKYGDWNLKSATYLDDITYYLIIEDFETHNYYGWPCIPSQYVILDIMKYNLYVVDFYKLANIHLRKEKLLKLKDK